MKSSSPKKITTKFSSSNHGLTIINKWLCRGPFLVSIIVQNITEKREIMRNVYSRLCFPDTFPSPTFQKIDVVADNYYETFVKIFRTFLQDCF